MSIDKRRDPRFTSDQELWCEGQTTVQARNMSKSGMLIVSDEARAIGDQLKVSFEDEEGTIEMKMEVMWCGNTEQPDQKGLGLRIVGFDKGEEAYERFVQRQLAAQGVKDEEPPK